MFVRYPPPESTAREAAEASLLYYAKVLGGAAEAAAAARPAQSDVALTPSMLTWLNVLYAEALVARVDACPLSHPATFIRRFHLNNTMESASAPAPAVAEALVVLGRVLADEPDTRWLSISSSI